jgi:catechol 2,3-dioxygenase-like lactoylglutathione lyase family enzyme
MVRLSNTRLLVADFPAMFRFYRDVLGFAPTFGTESDVYADFDAGGTSIALFRRDFMAQAVGAEGRPAEAEAQDRVALVFEAQDVDASYALLCDRGVGFINSPRDMQDWGIRAAQFRDPDGNLLEIYSPLQG